MVKMGKREKREKYLGMKRIRFKKWVYRSNKKERKEI